MESMIKLIKYILHKVEVRHLPMKYLTTLDIADLLPVASSDGGDLGPVLPGQKNQNSQNRVQI